MIRYSLYFSVICQLFLVINTEPIIGENVWPAMPNQFPFIASIGVKSSPALNKPRTHFCGGSLITTEHVLTAAHCLGRYPNNDIDVIVGEEDLRIARFGYDVETSITYDDWMWMNIRPLEYPSNDIAILKLREAVNRTGRRPVTLTPLNNQQLYGKSAIIAGWGHTNEGNLANVLRRTSVTILWPDEYARRVKLITNAIFIVETNYLSSASEPYALAACGDSGGPLVHNNNILLGVIRSRSPSDRSHYDNFTTEFINKYKMNRYSSVDYYREFIEDVTGLLTRPREVLAFDI